MASSFEIVTDFPAPADEVFVRSLDIDLHMASMKLSCEQAIAEARSGQIGLGETVTWRARHFGIWFTMTSKITALDAPHRFVDEQIRGPFKSFHHEPLFEAHGETTRMTDTITLASPVFGLVVERTIHVPYLRRLIRMRNAEIMASLH